jgi:hypothetical protein
MPYECTGNFSLAHTIGTGKEVGMGNSSGSENPFKEGNILLVAGDSFE